MTFGIRTRNNDTLEVNPDCIFIFFEDLSHFLQPDTYGIT